MLDVFIERGMPREGVVSFLVKTDSVLSEQDILAIQNGEGFDISITRPKKVRLVCKSLANRNPESRDDRVIRTYEWQCDDIYYRPENNKITTVRWGK